MRPYVEKNPHKKGAGGLAQRVGLKFKPSIAKNKKKEPQVQVTRFGFRDRPCSLLLRGN
jgi:hypothetical protein